MSKRELREKIEALEKRVLELEARPQYYYNWSPGYVPQTPWYLQEPQCSNPQVTYTTPATSGYVEVQQ